jgi:hypothetical protein
MVVLLVGFRIVDTEETLAVDIEENLACQGMLVGYGGFVVFVVGPGSMAAHMVVAVDCLVGTVWA